VFTKNVKVKVLVAYWTHSLDGTVQYLNALNYTNTLCYSSRYNKCKGNVEIKFFKVPGFDRTGPKLVSGSQVSNNTYPSYTRVLHAKYCVSDVRVHIGTSNLVWDYFYTTSGVSFGAYDAMLVSQLQAVFDADWASPYAFPYQSVESSPA
jgi:phospholipase D3/4